MEYKNLEYSNAFLNCLENSVLKPRPFIRKSFFTALRKVDIMNFRFHDLRHTYASHLVMSGVDLNTVRELMGHKDIRMTLRYAHLSSGHKGRAVEILGNKMDTIWTPEAIFTMPKENKVLQPLVK